MTSLSSIEVVCWLEFQHHNQNQHHKLPPHTKFQLHTSLSYQHISNFLFSLSSKWWRHQIRLSLLVDSNLNKMIEISIVNYLYILNFSFLERYCVTKIMAISCFHCLQNDDVIESDGICSWFKFQHHNQNQHHRLPLHTKVQLRTSLLCCQHIGNFVFSLSSKWWCDQIRLS